MNVRVMEEIGLTSAEIRVYLALLELGSSSTGKIIINSKVARSKVYELLERLKEKGLVTEAIKNSTRIFQAEDPERILDYIKKREESFKNKEKEFREILPILKSRAQYTEKQEAKVYTGLEGVKTFLRGVLQELEKGEEYLAMTFADQSINESIIQIFQSFHRQRAEKGIKAKILVNIDNKDVRKKMNFSNTGFYEFRTTKRHLPTGHSIFNDTVAIFNWGKIPRVFVIVCKENAEQYRKHFYDEWKR